MKFRKKPVVVEARRYEDCPCTCAYDDEEFECECGYQKGETLMNRAIKEIEEVGK